ncbi:LysR family transcriptional regulator [Pasteurella testudinis]|uniref:LysR family transcriptional regulator n=1 Tax=Pasteurella testudinis TaxID=761 RepID=UPI00405A2D37
MKANLNDLRAFVVVAETGSFTKAASRLRVSTSAVSHLIRNLEDHLKIKLFHRTTRKISLTDAGLQLYRDLAPLFDDIDHKINALSEFRNELKGTLRINGSDYGFLFGVWDKLLAFCRQYPEVNLELTANPRFVDIVAERFDAGLRLGGDVAKDMVAVRVSDDTRTAIVASPAYLTKHGTPQTPDELKQHRCLGLSIPSTGGVYAWECQTPNGECSDHNIDPYMVSNSSRILIQAAIDGLGICSTLHDAVLKEIAAGELVEVLPEYSVAYQGCYLYYPNRHHQTPVFRALVAYLKV